MQSLTGGSVGRLRAASARRAGPSPYGITLLPLPVTSTKTKRVRSPFHVLYAAPLLQQALPGGANPYAPRQPTSPTTSTIATPCAALSSYIDIFALCASTSDVAERLAAALQEDIKLMQRLGLRHFRFSVSWSRVIPDGSGEVNAAGLAFYSRLVDALLAAGIQPVVTVYHWDLPQARADLHGNFASTHSPQSSEGFIISLKPTRTLW